MPLSPSRFISSPAQKLLLGIDIDFITLNPVDLRSNKKNFFIDAIKNDVELFNNIKNIIKSLNKSGEQSIDVSLCLNNEYYHITFMYEQLNILNFFRRKKIIVMIKKITQNVVNHRFLHKAYQTQLEINKTKMAFLSRMSHEFRTPLNAVIGYSDAIQHKLHGDFPKIYHEYINNIHEAGTYLLDIVNDIMDISYAENNGLNVKPSSFKVISTIENLVQFMQSILTKHKIVVNIEYDIEYDTEIFNDFVLFKRIFINILGNVTKYCPEYASLNINITKSNHKILFDIKDNGNGYPDIIIKNFGIPFNVDHNFLTDTHKSTGLGLSIIKTAVETMQGHVHIYNHKEGGAAFDLSLPL